MIHTWVVHYGLWAVFALMTLESACIPIPSEVVMPVAGYLAFSHSQSLWLVVLVGTVANLLGGVIAYTVGRFGGRPFILRYGRYILLNEHHLRRAEAWFAKRGELTVLLSRLLPGLRTFISLPAGVAKMRPGRFLLYTTIGSAMWNFALAYAGYQLGRNWEAVVTAVKPLTYVGGAVLAIAILWFWFGRRRARRTS